MSGTTTTTTTTTEGELVPDVTNLSDLRREPTSGHKDLQGWRIRRRWSGNDTATVLAWADDRGCVLHEEQCSHLPEGAPTATGRLDDAIQLFAIEQPKGTSRWFDFCGYCLTEKIPNYGWEPTPRDLTLLATMQQVLNDVRVLGGKPISRVELTKRMARYGETAKPTELKRLLDHYDQVRDEEEPDLLAYIVR